MCRMVQVDKQHLERVLQAIDLKFPGEPPLSCIVTDDIGTIGFTHRHNSVWQEDVCRTWRFWQLRSTV